MTEAAVYAQQIGLNIPGIDRFQVPHHGSRRNVSTEILDLWLGPKLPTKPKDGEEKFYAMVSASKEDEDHPRKSVVRSLIHRGAGVATTKDSYLTTRFNAPYREGLVNATILNYPEEQEE